MSSLLNALSKLGSFEQQSNILKSTTTNTKNHTRRHVYVVGTSPGQSAGGFEPGTFRFRARGGLWQWIWLRPKRCKQMPAIKMRRSGASSVKARFCFRSLRSRCCCKLGKRAQRFVCARCRWLQYHDRDTGELPGTLPLAVGMPVALAAEHMNKARGLFKAGGKRFASTQIARIRTLGFFFAKRLSNLVATGPKGPRAFLGLACQRQHAYSGLCEV